MATYGIGSMIINHYLTTTQPLLFFLAATSALFATQTQVIYEVLSCVQVVELFSVSNHNNVVIGFCEKPVKDATGIEICS